MVFYWCREVFIYVIFFVFFYNVKLELSLIGFFFLVVFAKSVFLAVVSLDSR